MFKVSVGFCRQLPQTLAVEDDFAQYFFLNKVKIQYCHGPLNR